MLILAKKLLQNIPLERLERHLEIVEGLAGEPYQISAL